MTTAIEAMQQPLELARQLELADAESVADMMADALIRIARLSAEADPHRLVAEACRKELSAKLEASGAVAMPHPLLDIAVKIDRTYVENEEGLSALLDLKIGGVPVPPEEIQKAVWIEKIPATTVLKRNAGAANRLAKKYGREAQAAVDRAFTVVETRRVIIKPKPAPQEGLPRPNEPLQGEPECKEPKTPLEP